MGKRNFLDLYINPKGQPMHVGYGSNARPYLKMWGRGSSTVDPV